MHAKSLQSCPTLCDPMGWRQPSFSALEWIAMPFSRRSFQPRDRTHVSCLLLWQAGSLPLEPPGSRRWMLLNILQCSKRKKKKESPAQYVDSAKSRNPGLKIKVKSEQKKLFKIPISLRQDTFQCNYSKLQHLHKQYRIMRANVQNGVPELIL